MAKEPRAGRVKTRLGREIGMARAAWWFRHQLSARARSLVDRRWRIVLAVAPDTALTSRALPDLPRIAQGPGTLGDRMARVFERLGPGPVLIIGADIPGIARRHIAEGFATLARHDAVFGPATDGGYWAIGLTRPRQQPKSLFKGVRWSTAHAMADTILNIKECRVANLAVLTDVDVAADFAQMGGPTRNAPAKALS